MIHFFVIFQKEFLGVYISNYHAKQGFTHSSSCIFAGLPSLISTIRPYAEKRSVVSRN